MFQRKALTGIVFCLVLMMLMAPAALADPIQVDFSFTGSPNYFDSCNGSNCFAVEYTDPGSLSIISDPDVSVYDISFGSFTAELTGNGGKNVSQPFTLTINQTLPTPDGETYAEIQTNNHKEIFQNS